MLSIIWVSGMIAGFVFPKFLIQAIRSKDDENESPKNTALACLTFGICVSAILIVVSYS